MSSRTEREGDRIRRLLSPEKYAARKAAGLARLAEWTKNNPERVSAYKKAYDKANSSKSVARNRAARRRTKVLAYRMLGNECEICGCNVAEMLSIDHADGDGAEHRREMGAPGGYIVYREVVRGTSKRNLRLLCWSCNGSLGTQGYHPTLAMRSLYCGEHHVQQG